MFGFIPAPTACCSRAANVYRAHFCGLCNRMRSDYGLWSRLLINRDSAFLALLGSSLSDDQPVATRATCCNPWGEARALYQTGSLMHYVSAVTLCAVTTKLEDDGSDERGFRRTAAGAGAWLIQECSGKAAEILHSLGFPVEKVRSALQSQDNVEAAGEHLETAARPTATAYEEIVSYLGMLAGASLATQLALRKVGYQLGLLVYAKDTWDDFGEDMRRRRYNPLSLCGEGEAARRESLAPFLNGALLELTQAFAQLPLLRNRDLLHSMVVQGAGMRVAQVLSSDSPGKKEKDRRSKKCDYCDCSCDGCCDYADCCRINRCQRPSCRSNRGGGECCDCNPCDGDGFDCCGCDCG